jgi:chromosome segregation ATPase
MGIRRKLILVFVAAGSLCAGSANGQDAPSLGDLARQQRQQKEQSKTTQGKDTKASKVITNEEIPEHAGSATAPAASGEESRSSMAASSNGVKQPAEHVKSQILAQKNQIASLQRQVDELNESIRFAPANCVEGCVGWNERQREKQQRVERMQAQLEEEKRRLEDMQDSARKQGYGSSVYEP